MFLRYVDDLVRTVKGKPTCVLDAVNSLHRNLQFTLEKTNSEENLPFLDLNIKVWPDSGATCNWYQKPTDNGNMLKYRSSAPVCTSSVDIRGTVLKVFTIISIWEQFDKAMVSIMAQLLTNQHPEHWCTHWQQTLCAKSSRVRASL